MLQEQFYVRSLRTQHFCRLFLVIVFTEYIALACLSTYSYPVKTWRPLIAEVGIEPTIIWLMRPVSLPRLVSAMVESERIELSSKIKTYRFSTSLSYLRLGNLHAISKNSFSKFNFTIAISCEYLPFLGVTFL